MRGAKRPEEKPDLDPRLATMRGAKRPEEKPDLDPIEINAGQWYLRGLRSDGRLDDRPALADLGETDPEYVARSDAQWAADSCYSWAVCEVTTGELLAVVALDPATGAIATRARAGHGNAADAAADSVRRFAATIVVPKHHSG
jgi:hypothetical protein